MKKATTNVAASIHARLLKKAKAEGRPFNELVQYFAMERFLYRLSRTKHAARFILKGGLLLQTWGGPATRSTKDIDLLRRSSASLGELVGVIQDCIVVEVDDDGVRFDAASVVGEEIRAQTEYGGIRLGFTGKLGTTRLSMQVDVGFGDAITPAPAKIDYPTILDLAAPRLLAYHPETSLAEKLHAMVVLDMANSRMKDFVDVWTMAEGRQFSGASLGNAIVATFKRRGTELPRRTPIALTPAFHEDSLKQTQWRGYLRKARVSGAPDSLADAVGTIRKLVSPVLQASAAGQSFGGVWRPGGPWREEGS